ncbi:MAG TPA: hypothetical protein PKA61_09960 [Nitrospira sp.]|nr:hypothetical protein [Nitrospira sp.]
MSQVLQDIRKQRFQPIPKGSIGSIAQSQPDYGCWTIDECGQRGKVLVLRQDDIVVSAGEFEDRAIVESQTKLIANVNRSVCVLAEPSSKAGWEIRVNEELHPDRAGTILWFKYAAA